MDLHGYVPSPPVMSRWGKARLRTAVQERIATERRKHVQAQGRLRYLEVTLDMAGVALKDARRTIKRTYREGITRGVDDLKDLTYQFQRDLTSAEKRFRLAKDRIMWEYIDDFLVGTPYRSIFLDRHLGIPVEHASKNTTSIYSYDTLE